MTRMVTTVHSEDHNLYESISTCRFAMRVAMIKNELLRNEKMDPATIISRLKRENEELKAELAHYKTGNEKEFLTEEDKERCKHIVTDYLGQTDISRNMVVTDRLMSYHCYRLMKMMLISKGPSLGNSSGGGDNNNKVKAIMNSNGLTEQEKK